MSQGAQPSPLPGFLPLAPAVLADLSIYHDLSNPKPSGLHLQYLAVVSINAACQVSLS